VSDAHRLLVSVLVLHVGDDERVIPPMQHVRYSMCGRWRKKEVSNNETAPSDLGVTRINQLPRPFSIQNNQPGTLADIRQP
jgi:hypothetical protein